MNWYLRALKKYAVFQGRSRRKEYWVFALFDVIFSIIPSVIDVTTGGLPKRRRGSFSFGNPITHMSVALTGISGRPSGFGSAGISHSGVSQARHASLAFTLELIKP